MKEILQLELWRQLLIFVPLGITLLICAGTDARGRKIYNKVTYPAFLLGLLAHTIALGFSGLTSGLIAAFGTFAIGLLVMAIGVMRAGDIKLFMVVAAFLGSAATFQVFFYAIFAGAAMGVLISLFNGFFLELVKRTWALIRGWFQVLLYRTAALKPELEHDERFWLPFGISIFAGGILTLTDHIYGTPGLFSLYFKELGF